MNSYLETILACFSLVTFLQIHSDAEQTAEKVSGPYLGQSPPGMEPVLFAPGIIPVEGIQHCVPTISPDGKEVYWTTIEFIDDKPFGKIWFTAEAGGFWSNPRIAPFSGTYDDRAPFISHDGKRIYFASSRPGGEGKGKNVWYVDKTDSGWSEPQHLGSPPNSDRGATQATFTRDGTAYFVGRCEGAQWNSAIYRSRFKDGKYSEPELLGAPIATPHADVYPFIAPDESYLLFGSSRPGANSTETDLYISFRDSNDTWSEPIQFGESVNNGKTVSFSFVTHDGKYLLFNRFDEDGTDKFYWVDAKILEKYLPAQDTVDGDK